MSDKLQDKFKNFVTNEEEQEPLEGHFERFEARLKKLDNKKNRFTINPMWMGLLAACFIGVICTVIFLQEPEEVLTTNNNTNTLTLADYSQEAGRKEAFYTAEIKKQEIGLEYRSQKDVEDLFAILDRLDNEYIELNNKLKVNFHNEHVINAILDNYRLRLEVMEKIQKIIEVKNRIKNTNNEKDIL